MTNNVPPTICVSRRASVVGPDRRRVEDDPVEPRGRLLENLAHPRRGQRLDRVGDRLTGGQQREPWGDRRRARASARWRARSASLRPLPSPDRRRSGWTAGAGRRRSSSTCVAVRLRQHQRQIDGGQGLAVTGVALVTITLRMPLACCAWCRCRPGGGTARSGPDRRPGRRPAVPATTRQSSTRPGRPEPSGPIGEARVLGRRRAMPSAGPTPSRPATARPAGTRSALGRRVTRPPLFRSGAMLRRFGSQRSP